MVLRWEDVDLKSGKLFVNRFAVERKALPESGEDAVYGVENAVGQM